MSKSNSPFLAAATRVAVAFFGAMLMIRVDTGGTVWLKFTRTLFRDEFFFIWLSSQIHFCTSYLLQVHWLLNDIIGGATETVSGDAIAAENDLTTSHKQHIVGRRL